MHACVARDRLADLYRPGLAGRMRARQLLRRCSYRRTSTGQPAGACSRNKVDERMNSGWPAAASNNLYAGDDGRREYHAGVPAGGRSYVVAGPAGRHGHWLQLHT